MRANWNIIGRRGASDRQGCTRADRAETILCGALGLISGRFAADARSIESFARRRGRQWKADDTDEFGEPRRCSNPQHPRRGVAEHWLLPQTQDARETQ